MENLRHSTRVEQYTTIGRSRLDTPFQMLTLSIPAL